MYVVESREWKMWDSRMSSFISVECMNIVEYLCVHTRLHVYLRDARMSTCIWHAIMLSCISVCARMPSMVCTHVIYGMHACRCVSVCVHECHRVSLYVHACRHVSVYVHECRRHRVYLHMYECRHLPLGCKNVAHILACIYAMTSFFWDARMSSYMFWDDRMSCIFVNARMFSMRSANFLVYL